MKLYIKNMVCDRCIMVVRSELEKLGLELMSINLGEVETTNDISVPKKGEVSRQLAVVGFELIDSKKSQTVEKIKTLIVDLVHHKNNNLVTNLSGYITSHVSQDYNSLSSLFSEEEGTTIEKYYIHQKIEKVKELLMYGELSLSEISFQLNYSSVGYLSNQFKKITGYSPSVYKQLSENERKQIDRL